LHNIASAYENFLSDWTEFIQLLGELNRAICYGEVSEQELRLKLPILGLEGLAHSSLLVSISSLIRAFERDSESAFAHHLTSVDQHALGRQVRSLSRRQLFAGR
jgi:hypothetical protein